MQQGWYSGKRVVGTCPHPRYFVSAHFKHGNPSSLPSWTVAHVEMWGNGIYYVRFVRDLQEDNVLHKAVAPFSHIIP